tara:strand:+ start:129 stop:626 length:498 start_codon:yes stop_codon:yes gene_type:complete
MIQVRPASDDDFEAVWRIFHRVVSEGDTYPYSPDTNPDEARSYWMEPPARPYVALDGNRISGTYILKPNQPGLGSHVVNAGFMVDPAEQGRGIGRVMVEHALAEARHLGYRAMQFNLVVSTNTAAVALWKKVGFEIVGTLPGAFHHPEHGYVDAYVMYKTLDDYR